jgi:hypothetical protein
LIYQDNQETWTLVGDDRESWAVERSGQRRKLEIPLDAFEKTEDGLRLAESLALAKARATANA